MATVTRKFRDDFETWAADRINRGAFTIEEMAEFKDMLRRDLTPGPDLLREGLTVFLVSGVEVPATIDDHEERYCLWSHYFALGAERIHGPHPNKANNHAPATFFNS